MLTGEVRKRMRKKLVEAILCCNDKRRLQHMADSKLLLREVGAREPFAIGKKRTSRHPPFHPLSPPHTPHPTPTNTTTNPHSHNTNTNTRSSSADNEYQCTHTHR